MKKMCFIAGILAFFILNVFFISNLYACWWKGIPYVSPDVDNDPGPDNKPPGNGPKGGEPVYLYNGELIYLNLDLIIPAKGINIDIRHTYSSHSRLNGRFGLGWDMSYNKQIIPLANGDAVYLDGCGGKLKFFYVDGTNYTPSPGVFDTLKQNPDGTYTLTKMHGTKYKFAANGTLTEIKDKNNNVATFAYDDGGKLPITGVPVYTNDPVTPRVIAYQYMLTKITDANNRSITFTYDTNGRLTKITDFKGREVKYAYNSLGHLTSITDPLNKITQFTYNSDRNIYTITDRRGNLILTHNYNQVNQVISQDFVEDTFYFEYDAEGFNSNLTEFTDETGKIWKYRFSDSGRPTEITDPNENVTQKSYDSRLNLISTIYPDHHSVYNNYDSNGNLTEIVRESTPAFGGEQTITTLTYDLTYNLIKTITYPDETVDTFEYDAGGNLLKVTGRDGGITTYMYNSPNFKVTNPLGQMTTFVFNNNGYIISKTTPDGKITTYAYDLIGNCTSVTEPNNLTTTYEYDACDQLTKKTDPNQNITTYTYDGNGNLTKIVYPDTSFVSFTYDSDNQLVDPEQAKDLPPAIYNPTTAIVQEFIATAFEPIPYRFLESIDPEFGHCFSLLDW